MMTVMKNRGMLRFSVIGNVDDGKSTLIGRLLSDTKSIFEDQLLALEEASWRRGDRSINLALLTDGLRQEREKGITIDVAYRYFSTPIRKFIVADCPGHFEYTRNMVTGTSQSDASVIMIDATQGLREQTRRHAFISSMMGIRHLIVCVNKMDLMNYSEEIFTDITRQMKVFLQRLKIPHVYFIPMSALQGDNVVEISPQMKWYPGNSLLGTLEGISGEDEKIQSAARLPLQMIHSKKVFSGRVESGSFKVGEEISFLPNNEKRTILNLAIGEDSISEAIPGMSVTVTLDDDLELDRGHMAFKKNFSPLRSSGPEVLLCWLHEQPGMLSRRYLVRHTTRELGCQITAIRSRLNLTTMIMEEGRDELHHNEIMQVALKTDDDLFMDSYQLNRSTGSIVLIDIDTHDTLAAGLLV